jgi:putative ABC transport system permease protein
VRLRWVLAGLALQNVGRRKARTALLAGAVAISCAIVFAGAVMLRSIGASMAVGFSRLGADLMVVPADALINITAALLAVEPTDQTVDANLLAAPIAGIARAAPQRVLRTEHSGFGGHGESVDIIGFDPERDFTVQPWISERLGRRMQAGDVIVGAGRDLQIGSEIVLFGRAFRIYAKLGRTGVGTHERGIFMPSEELLDLAAPVREHIGRLPAMLEPSRVSGFLIEIAPGSTELQIRFALLSRLTSIKVVTGEALLTGIRQGLGALLDGSLALVAMTFASTVIMVCVLFSAIVAERHNELGLLKAIGARRRQIVGLMVIEAMIVTGAGGVIGVVFGELLMRLFARSLVYHLTALRIPFLWLGPRDAIVMAAVCIVVAASIGAAGAIIPAWRASRRDAYDLILGAG